MAPHRSNDIARNISVLIDPSLRMITYLRISVTDRCDFRCAYCMAEDMQFLPKRDLLSLEELDRLCGVFIARGVRKLRITGSEPLVRRDIMHLFRRLSRHLGSGALDELTLTTNGSQLARFAPELADLGVRRIASVRYLRESRRGDETKVSHWIATLAFGFEPRAKMSTSDRLVNPLGFLVSEYRSDPELAP